ncbi:MAG: hypothetical protein IGS03_11595 [Candidatus Sericytochromatia bacterium]|nr:hypothetical protein [Candidatus Sericytochromatia bacterium]
MNKAVSGSALLGLSAFMLLGFFNADLAPGVAFATFLIAVVLPGGAGGYLLYLHQQDKQRVHQSRGVLAQRTLAAETLAFARAQGGRLTVLEVATRFALSTSEAEQLLDQMALEGHADYQVTDEGLIVYTFAGVQQLDSKHQSKRLEDA